MSSSPSPVVVALALALVASMSNGARAASDIGHATAIKTSVTGTLETQSIILKTGDTVFAKQTVATDGNGVGQFEFKDRTKLAIGPGSTVILDDFVYNPKSSGSKVVLELTRGSFRFMTGGADHDAYEIRTPTATIGVRGTAFDLYVADSGEVAIAMIDGAVQVCPRGGTCRLHDIVGRFLHMSIDGSFSLHDTWDGTFFKGVALTTALPFIADQRLLTPAFRGQTKIVDRYVVSTTKAVTKTIKQVTRPKVKLPKLKLPKLFK